MKGIFVFGGIIMFIGSILLMHSKKQDLYIERDGEMVMMEIIKLPASCLGTKANHFVTLRYSGEDFIKKIGGHFCDEHHVGEKIQIKFLEGRDVVLFPYESVAGDLIAFGLLGVLGLGCFFKGLRSDK